MPKWKLLIEYEGTRYRGWQEQKNARTIQGELYKTALRGKCYESKYISPDK